jgi:hypothetical protein
LTGSAAGRHTDALLIAEEAPVDVKGSVALVSGGASLGAQVPHRRRVGDLAEYGAPVEHNVADPMLNGAVIRLDGAIRMAPR